MTANSTTHTITITIARTRHDTRTQHYITRRPTEGNSDTEIRHCIKQHLAHSLFRLLEHTAEQTP